MTRRRRFIGHSDPYLFAYAPGRLSHRSDAALCFFASLPGQAILHVVRTLVKLGQRRRNESLMIEGSARLSVGDSPSLHRSALQTGNPRTEFHKGTLPLTREACSSSAGHCPRRTGICPLRLVRRRRSLTNLHHHRSIFAFFHRGAVPLCDHTPPSLVVKRLSYEAGYHPWTTSAGH